MVISRKRQFSGTPASRYSKKPRVAAPRFIPYKREERKRKYYGLAPISPGSTDIVLYNPLYYLVPGTSRDQRIGNRVTTPKLHYSIMLAPMAINALTDPVDQSVVCRIVVFTHPKEWRSTAEGAWDLNTAGVGTIISAGDILKDTGADRSAQSYLNIDEIKVLHDKIVHLPRPEPGLSSNDDYGPAKLVKGSVSLGDYRFNDATNAFGRDRNVYIAVMSSSGSGATLVDSFNMRTNFLLTYDDI